MNRILTVTLFLLITLTGAGNLFSQSVPTINTSAVSGITQTTASGGGEILDNGGADIIVSGLVWSVAENPTTENNDGITTDGSDAGTFKSHLYGLSAGTGYYVRAYATNSAGTSYGENREFSTAVPADCGIITDARDGKTYSTVLIGSQCWMAENLKYMPEVTGSGSEWNSTQPKYTVSGYTSSLNSVEDAMATSGYLNYGVLYNFPAATTACPDGWHLPAKVEWTVLLDYINTVYGIGNTNTSYGAGNTLKSCRQNGSPLETGCNTSSHPRWDSNSDNFGTNGLGFSAMPGGLRTSSGSFSPAGYYGSWWTSTEDYPSYVGISKLSYSSGNLISNNTTKETGNSVRCVKNAGPLSSIPTVNTVSATNVDHISAVAGGNVSNDGSSAVYDRGLIWGTSDDINIDSNQGIIRNGTGTGEFVCILNGLENNLTYYIRAFAINETGIAYGEILNFTTPDFTNCGTITDARDGKTYSTVVIGSQCWMAENLKYLPEVTGDISNWTSTNPKYAVNGYSGTNNSVSEAITNPNYDNYGVLYNWYASKTACPEGWHLPSFIEWTVLLDYLEYEYDIQNENTLNGAGNALKSCRQMGSPFSCNCNTSEEPRWDQHYNIYGTNRFGFNGLPGGSITSAFSSPGYNAYWWLSDSSSYSTTVAFNVRLSNATGLVGISLTSGNNKSAGFSVRCIRNMSESAQIPSVNTVPLTELSITSLQSGGNIIGDGGSAILQKGLVYDTLPNPTIESGIGFSSNGTGVAGFIDTISGLMVNKTYYVRAYAINEAGTSYGETLSFLSGDYPNCGLITDTRDGRVYRTVNIGDQCWMAEDLKYLPEVTGPNTSWNSTEPRYAVYNYTDPLNSTEGAKLTDEFKNYGALYNWTAALTACPDGWHLPKDAEWNVLLDYLFEEYNYININGLNGVAGALKSCRQTGSPIGCGCDVTEHPRWDNNIWIKSNNITGFGAIPSGNRSTSGVFGNLGNLGIYWTSDEYSTTNSLTRYMDYYYTNVFSSNNVKTLGNSVRCIKDCSPTATVPDIGILPVTDNLPKSANVEANILSDGGSVIYSKGFIYGTSPDLTIEDNLGITSNGTNAGSFSMMLSGLEPNTVYYVKAYAINNVGIAYSEELSFATSQFPDCGNIVDSRDGKIYKTVIVGEQCWMAENLKYLPSVTGPSNQWSSTEPRYGVYGYSSASNSVTDAMANENYLIYSVFYNWTAAQTACPEGWHLPAYLEWNPLLVYLSNTLGIINADTYNGAANALKSCRQTDSPLACECSQTNPPAWSASTIHYGTDLVGFSALPAGYRKTNGGFINPKVYSDLWTSDEVSLTHSVIINMEYDSGLVDSLYYEKIIGASIRCVKNPEESAGIPAISTNPASEVTRTSAKTGVIITGDGGSVVTLMGIVYGVTPNPTIESNDKNIQLLPTSSEFEVVLTKLLNGTTYYVRAYAINSVGISYGNEIVFETEDVPNCGLLTDNRDGNVYKTVEFGSQCWMAENLKFLPQVTGPVAEWIDSGPHFAVYGYTGSDNSVVDAKASENYQKYGVLYNRLAASPNGIYSNSNPSGVQGVCPTGWHLPGNDEWLELLMFIGMDMSQISGYGCTSSSEGSFLAGNSLLWNSGGLINDSLFGESGFNALPGGGRSYSGNFNYIGNTGAWFTCSNQTQNDNYYWKIQRGYTISCLSVSNDLKESFSVRCIKNSLLVSGLPELTTLEVSYFTNQYAISGGVVISDGDYELSATGIVWDVVHNPTIENNQGLTDDGIATGYYQSTIPDLVQGTTYYIRAYATSSEGTAYGNEVVFYADFCNPMTVEIISSSPEPDVNGFVNLCWDFTNNQSMEVNFEATGTYPASGYPLGDENVVFKWNFDDGSPIQEGMGLSSVTHVFTERAGYNVTLIIEDTASCRSNNNAFKKVRIPLLSGWVAEETNVVPDIINPGEPVQVCAGYTSEEWETGEEYQIISSTDTLFLPDTPPACFETSIDVNIFENGQLFESAEDLNAIGMNLVHTYLGDLTFRLECPNGQYVQLGIQGGGGCNLGVPPDQGYWYVITPEATQTMESAANGLVTLPAGNYAPWNDFSGFIGCPMNGNWTLRICDNWSADDGYVFGWYLDFEESVFPEVWGYANTYTSVWSGDYLAQIYNPENQSCTSATYLMTETPDVTTVQPFVFTLTDDFGCVYDTTLYVTVNAVQESPPVLVTDEITSVTYSSAVSGGVIYDEGSSEVISRGVVWSTSENPTVETNSGLSHDGSGIGDYLSNITSLFPDMTYYVRAYATNSYGTAYGQQESFITGELPPVTCPEDIVVCENNNENIVLTGAFPEGGVYKYNGAEITDLNPASVGPGEYYMVYSYDLGIGFEESCAFIITVVPGPEQINLIQNPETGILDIGSLGEISIANSEVGVVYWVSLGDEPVTEEIPGTGDLILLGSGFSEGTYSVWSSSANGCELLQGTVAFTENAGTNKIVAFVTHGNPPEIFPAGHVKVTLYGVFIDDENNSHVETVEDQILNSEGQAEFNNLSVGDYYLGATLLYQEQYNVLPHVYYQSALIHEDAEMITISEGTVYLANINYSNAGVVNGSNTGHGLVGIIDNDDNITALQDMVVVLKDIDENEILDISVTDSGGQYAFANIPDNTNIQMFVTSIEHQTWIPYEILTGDGYDYNVDFIVNGDLVYPDGWTSISGSIAENLKFEIFPNPAHDEVYFTDVPENSRLKIFDIEGSEIINLTISDQNKINIAGFVPGTYIFTVLTPDGQTGIKKFIKE